MPTPSVCQPSTPVALGAVLVENNTQSQENSSPQQRKSDNSLPEPEQYNLFNETQPLQSKSKKRSRTRLSEADKADSSFRSIDNLQKVLSLLHTTLEANEDVREDPHKLDGAEIYVH